MRVSSSLAKLTDDFANLVGGEFVIFFCADVFKSASIRCVEQLDRSFVELDGGRINVVVMAEVEKLAADRIKQTLEQLISPANCGDHANLINPLTTVLRQRVKRFSDDLRHHPGNAKQNVSFIMFY